MAFKLALLYAVVVSYSPLHAMVLRFDLEKWYFIHSASRFSNNKCCVMNGVHRHGWMCLGSSTLLQCSSSFQTNTNTHARIHYISSRFLYFFIQIHTISSVIVRICDLFYLFILHAELIMNECMKSNSIHADMMDFPVNLIPCGLFFAPFIEYQPAGIRGGVTKKEKLMDK